MSLFVKICGVRSEDALDAAIAAGADCIGLVFFPRSPRHLSPSAGRSLADKARGRIETVALTVDADDALLDTIVREVRPSALQLHGHETPERVAELKQRFGLPITKALPVSTREDLAAAQPYARIANRLLFDARPPAAATRPGGLGSTFDWTLLAGRRFAQPFLLSGGLTPDNVADAVRITGANGVDVSSGVERRPGEKDPLLISAFVRAARAANMGAGAALAHSA